MTEERKLATMLFADIVGSSGPVASEDPEVVRRTLSRTFAEMRETLTAHGGTVEKFIGDAVMAVFGVPQTHDDDADRAVRAAFTLRTRLAELSKTLPYELHLRIGIDTGQVVAGSQGVDTLVTGGAVNAAARLQQAASPDEILVGTTTRGLTELEVRYGLSRQVKAKGMGVIDAHPAEALITSVPERKRGLQQLRAPLIGRDAELRMLRDSLARTTEEQSARLVTLYGQAGVGKSRLVAEFVDQLPPDRVLRGRCLPYGSGITYWPLLEMIRAAAGIEATDDRGTAAQKLGSAVRDVAGPDSDEADAIERRLSIVAGLADPGDALTEVSGSDLGRELRWGVRRYLEQRADSAPLVIVFDDIQWAEQPLFATIEHLAEWVRAPLLIVCLARPELRDTRPNWASGVTNSASLKVEPLVAEETRRLVAALLDIDELPERLRSEVIQRSQGNPLFVEEFLRMLMDAGQVVRSEGRSVATADVTHLPLPTTIQGLLAARLDQLPVAVKRVLQIAAIIGEVFDPDALLALAQLNEDVDEVLLAAARHDLIRESDERGLRGKALYAFRHILIRDAAYESLPKQERSALHDRYGRWLADVTGDRYEEFAAIVAHHAYEAYRLAAELHDPTASPLGQRALDVLLAAARKSRSADDPRARYELHRRAAEVAEAVGAPLAIRIETRGFAASQAYTLDGKARAPEVEAALPLARQGGPSEALVVLLLARANWLVASSDIGAGAAGHDEALTMAKAYGDPEVVARARIERARVAEWTGDMSQANEMLTDAYRYLVANGIEGLLRDVALWALHDNAIQRGDWMRLAEWHGDLAKRRGHASKYVRLVVRDYLAFWHAHVAGDHLAAAEALARGTETQREFGEPVIVARTEKVRGHELYHAGRYAEALEAVRGSLAELERLGLKANTAEHRQFFARVLVKLGRLAEARTAAESSYSEIDERDAMSRCTAATSLAMVEAAEGRPAQAERLFRQALADAHGYRFTAMETRREFIEFLLAQRRHAEARALAEEMVLFFAPPPPTSSGPRPGSGAAREQCPCAQGVPGSLRDAKELLSKCEEVAAAP